MAAVSLCDLESSSSSSSVTTASSSSFGQLAGLLLGCFRFLTLSAQLFLLAVESLWLRCFRFLMLSAQLLLLAGGEALSSGVLAFGRTAVTLACGVVDAVLLSM